MWIELADIARAIFAFAFVMVLGVGVIYIYETIRQWWQRGKELQKCLSSCDCADLSDCKFNDEYEGATKKGWEKVLDKTGHYGYRKWGE